jgi:hypothetical protein
MRLGGDASERRLPRSSQLRASLAAGLSACLAAKGLAKTALGLSLFPLLALGRLLVEPALLELFVDAFVGHLTLELVNRPVDVVAVDADLEGSVGRPAVFATTNQNITSIGFGSHGIPGEGGTVSGMLNGVNALFSCSSKGVTGHFQRHDGLLPLL